MRPFQIIIASLLCGLALWTEFKTIKESALFTDWLNVVPFWTLCALTIFFIVANTHTYYLDKQIISFLPLLICVTALSVVLWHQNKIKSLDNSQTKFTATSYDIGSDGGFILDFKLNGHLKAEKRDHWTVTYYWGNYTQNLDTINLNIALDFKLARQALLTDDSLHLLGDTTRFIVFRQ